MRIQVEHVIQFLEGVAAIIKENRGYLTELDSAIGDADHGINLDRGFTAVVAKLPTVADKDIGTILKTVGMTLISTVGGAAGPLYGTAFLRAATAVGDKTELTSEDVLAAAEAALEGVMARGKSERGQSTMIDALGPGVDSLKAALGRGEDMVAALREATAATEEGMKSTIAMLATKGRASYLGERSIGHQDPGATSTYLMTKVALEIAEGIATQ